MKFILDTHGCIASLNPSKSSQLRDLPGGAIAVTAAGFFKAFGMAKMASTSHGKKFHEMWIDQNSFFLGINRPVWVFLFLHRLNVALHAACGPI